MLIIQQSPKAIEKYKHRFGFPRNLKLFDACFSEFKDTQIKLDKISHQGGWNITIINKQDSSSLCNSKISLQKAALKGRQS